MSPEKKEQQRQSRRNGRIKRRALLKMANEVKQEAIDHSHIIGRNDSVMWEVYNSLRSQAARR